MPVISAVKAWSAFNVDAVGLVTLLGANTLQNSLGRLVQHPWAECFPLLAGHIVPDDLLCEPIPGFTLYNVTDGIMVSGVNAWFSRWLMSQELSRCSTTLNAEVVSRKRSPDLRYAVSVGLGLVLHAFLIVFSILIDDWYAFAASVSLALSTSMRVIFLMMCRATLDGLVKEAMDLSTLPVKVILRLPNNKSVTIYTTRGVVIKCFIEETRPRNHPAYRTLRAVGWVAFGVFIVTLGMACLAMQIIIALLMIVSSVIVVRRFGCNDSFIGSSIHIEQSTRLGKETYMRTYAALQLNEKEEAAMVNWHLFPLRSNEAWWESYYQFNKEFQKNPTAFEK